MGLLASTVILKRIQQGRPGTEATCAHATAPRVCTLCLSLYIAIVLFSSIQQLFYSALLSNYSCIQLYSAIIVLFSSIQQLFYSDLFSNCSIQLYSATAIVLLSYFSIQQNDDSVAMYILRFAATSDIYTGTVHVMGTCS